MVASASHCGSYSYRFILSIVVWDVTRRVLDETGVFGQTLTRDGTGAHQKRGRRPPDDDRDKVSAWRPPPETTGFKLTFEQPRDPAAPKQPGGTHRRFGTLRDLLLLRNCCSIFVVRLARSCFRIFVARFAAARISFSFASSAA